MKNLIIYKFNNEIKSKIVTTDKEYNEIKNTLYNNDSKYTLIKWIDLDNKFAHDAVISALNRIITEYFECCFILNKKKTNEDEIEVEITLRKQAYITAYTLTIHNDFYLFIERFLNDCGFEVIDYNNNKNVFWFKRKED